jgi:hypothetical protein
MADLIGGKADLAYRSGHVHVAQGRSPSVSLATPAVFDNATLTVLNPPKSV